MAGMPLARRHRRADTRRTLNGHRYAQARPTEVHDALVRFSRFHAPQVDMHLLRLYKVAGTDRHRLSPKGETRRLVHVSPRMNKLTDHAVVRGRVVPRDLSPRGSWWTGLVQFVKRGRQSSRCQTPVPESFTESDRGILHSDTFACTTIVTLVVRLWQVDDREERYGH